MVAVHRYRVGRADAHLQRDVALPVVLVVAQLDRLLLPWAQQGALLVEVSDVEDRILDTVRSEQGVEALVLVEGFPSLKVAKQRSQRLQIHPSSVLTLPGPEGGPPCSRVGGPDVPLALG